jgi:hypothetical protein
MHTFVGSERNAENLSSYNAECLDSYIVLPLLCDLPLLSYNLPASMELKPLLGTV